MSALLTAWNRLSCLVGAAQSARAKQSTFSTHGSTFTRGYSTVCNAGQLGIGVDGGGVARQQRRHRGRRCAGQQPRGRAELSAKAGWLEKVGEERSDTAERAMTEAIYPKCVALVFGRTT